MTLIGKRIDLLYHPERMQRVEARHNNESYGLLRAVDTAVNCRVKRDRRSNLQIAASVSSAPNGGKIW